jgi:hypothetical protein
MVKIQQIHFEKFPMKHPVLYLIDPKNLNTTINKAKQHPTVNQSEMIVQNLI